MVLPTLSHAQTAVNLGPAPLTCFRNLTTDVPLAGGQVATFAAGTSTPQPTFTDSSGITQNANPTILASDGCAQIWFSGLAYKIKVSDMNGVQQFVTDNFSIGVFAGGNTTFTGNNIFSGTTTFNGSLIANSGGSLNGTFSGNPNFSGSPSFSGTLVASQFQSTVTTGTPPFIVASTTEVANLNVAALDGCVTTGTPSAGQVLQASGATTCGWVTASQFPTVVYSTASAAGHASLGATTMVTVGGSDATYRYMYYVQLTTAGSSCSGSTNLVMNTIWQDPLDSGARTMTTNFELANNGNGTVGEAFNPSGSGPDGNSGTGASGLLRAKTGTVIQYSTTYSVGSGCSPGPSYRIWPILEQITAN